eukprot:2928764-Rhodomonas_salina.1
MFSSFSGAAYGPEWYHAEQQQAGPSFDLNMSMRAPVSLQIRGGGRAPDPAAANPISPYDLYPRASAH